MYCRGELAPILEHLVLDNLTVTEYVILIDEKKDIQYILYI